MSTAHARNSDPITSHMAANSVKDFTELQKRILSLFDMSNAGLTDEELIKAYKEAFGFVWPATDSSLRSRRSDLHHRGSLRDTGTKRLTKAGGKTIVWDIFGRLL